MERRLSLSGETLTPRLASLIDGIGLLRSEYVLRFVGESFRTPSGREAVRTYVAEVADVAAPRPVWYRLADLWSDEANPLAGSVPISQEANPMVGLRGIRPGLLDPPLLELEIHAIATLAHTRPNLHLFVPFVADEPQLRLVVQLLEAAEWPNRFGAMVEIPSALLAVEGFLEAGASNLLVGLNDLTSLMLGAERSSAFYSKHHPAVIWALGEVAHAAAGRAEWGVAGMLDPQIIERSEEMQADYVSVHYSQAAALLELPEDVLPQGDHAAEVRRRTRQRAALVDASRTSG